MLSINAVDVTDSVVSVNQN